MLKKIGPTSNNQPAANLDQYHQLNCLKLDISTCFILSLSWQIKVSQYLMKHSCIFFKLHWNLLCTTKFNFRHSKPLFSPFPFQLNSLASWLDISLARILLTVSGKLLPPIVARWKIYKEKQDSLDKFMFHKAQIFPYIESNLTLYWMKVDLWANE